MISLERVIEIFIAEGFDVFSANGGSVELVSPAGKYELPRPTDDYFV